MTVGLEVFRDDPLTLESRGWTSVSTECTPKLSALASERRKRLIPVNVTGAIGAIALDMGYPWQITKAFALIGRTLGAIGHIAEEIRNPMATKIDAAIKQAVVYEPYRT